MLGTFETRIVALLLRLIHNRHPNAERHLIWNKLLTKMKNDCEKILGISAQK